MEKEIKQLEEKANTYYAKAEKLRNLKNEIIWLKQIEKTNLDNGLKGTYINFKTNEGDFLSVNFTKRRIINLIIELLMKEIPNLQKEFDELINESI